MGQKTYASLLRCGRCDGYERYVKMGTCAPCARERVKFGGGKLDPPKGVHLNRTSATVARAPFYWPGTRCAFGHQSLRYTRYGWCRACVDWGIIKPAEDYLE